MTDPIKPMSNDTEQVNVIHLDKQIINTAIKDKGKYETEGITILNWEDESGQDLFITDIKNDSVNFIGVLNGKFVREGYGWNKFSNGDQYLGYFEDDKRMKHGVYLWKPTIKDNTIIRECYHGCWRNDTKGPHGIYIWMVEPVGNTEFDKADFDAYVGTYEKETYKRGTYLSKKGENYYVYHGNFDEKGKKNDDNGYYYSDKKDRLIKGKIVDDKFINGYITYFDEKGDIKELVYCEFNDDGTVKSLTQKSEIGEEKALAMSDDLTLFRNYLIDYDYFGGWFDKYKAVVKFIDEDITSVEVMNDKDKFPEMITLCTSYNYNNIYNSIEKNVFKNKEN